MKTEAKTCYKNSNLKFIKIMTKKLPKWWPKRAPGPTGQCREKCGNRLVSRQSMFFSLPGLIMAPGRLQFGWLVSLLEPTMAPRPLQNRFLMHKPWLPSIQIAPKLVPKSYQSVFSGGCAIGMQKSCTNVKKRAKMY